MIDTTKFEKYVKQLEDTPEVAVKMLAYYAKQAILREMKSEIEIRPSEILTEFRDE